MAIWLSMLPMVVVVGGSLVNYVFVFFSVHCRLVSSLVQRYWPPTGYVGHTISVGYLNVVLTLFLSKLISRFVVLL